MIRIVKMTFQNDKVEDFLEIFNEIHTEIKNFDGVISLKLHRQINQPNVLFTVSEWASPEKLENYRNSDLFKRTWAKTKVLFADKPEAWSLEEVI
jgi:hypothetical protein